MKNLLITWLIIGTTQFIAAENYYDKENQIYFVDSAVAENDPVDFDVLPDQLVIFISKTGHSASLIDWNGPEWNSALKDLGPQFIHTYTSPRKLRQNTIYTTIVRFSLIPMWERDSRKAGNNCYIRITATGNPRRPLKYIVLKSAFDNASKVLALKDIPDSRTHNSLLFN